MSVDIGSIIARLILDRSQFSDSLAAARAEAAAFPDVKVGIDASRFDAGWAEVMAKRDALAGTTDPNVGIDDGPFMAGAAAVEAMKAALGRGVEVPVHWAISPMAGPALAGAGAAGGGGGGADVIPVAAGGGGGGGGGGGATAGLLGLLGLAGKGKSGGVFGLGAGLPAAGTALAFGGLGIEHIVMTLAGLAGSAAGGVLGGGLLGLGSLGKFGVGMGTDLAGIGQAAGDTKTAVTDMNALSRATALYGANSTQAATAQKQLNYDLAAFSPLARSAVVQAANTAQGFVTMFDQATGAAEKTGAQIITQLIGVGEKFLPTIGKYAAENMGIIQSSLQPLFAWIQGPGLAIFNQLEGEFQRELPTAMHAFTQGVELFIKTVGVASTYTGGFMVKLDHFLTRINSPAGFAVWSKEIGKLIADFHLWGALISALGRDIYDLFSNDAGTASSIVSSLTQMLDKLGAWERSTQGKAQLHNIFEVHKQEILDLLKVLPPLLSSLGNIYLTVAPALTGALVTVLGAITPVLNALAKNPAGAWILGLTLIGAKLGLLSGPLGALGKVVYAPIAAGIKSVALSAGLFSADGALSLASYAKGFGLLAAGAGAFYATTKALDAIYGKPKPGVSHTTSLTPQAVAAIQQNDAQPRLPHISLPPPDPSKFETFWTNLKHWLWLNWSTIDTDTRHWAGNIENVAVGAWQHIDTDARHWFGDVEPFLVGVGQHISTDATHWSSNVYSALDGSWQRVDTDARHWFGDVENFLSGTGQHISTDARHWSQNVYSALDGSWQRANTDARHWFGDVESFLSGTGQHIGSDAGHWSSNIYNVLDAAWQRANTSVRHWFGDVISFFKGLPGQITGALGNLGGLLYNAGRSIVQGLLNGIGSLAGSVAGAIANLIPGGGAAQTVLGKLGIHLPGHLAAGTNSAAGGLTVVGEEGPELVNMPAGSQVFPAGRTAAMLAGMNVRGGGGGGGGQFTLVDNRRITLAPPPGMSEAALRQVVSSELARLDQDLVGTIKQLVGVAG